MKQVIFPKLASLSEALCRVLACCKCPIASSCGGGHVCGSSGLLAPCLWAHGRMALYGLLLGRVDVMMGDTSGLKIPLLARSFQTLPYLCTDTAHVKEGCCSTGQGNTEPLSLCSGHKI